VVGGLIVPFAEVAADVQGEGTELGLAMAAAREEVARRPGSSARARDGFARRHGRGFGPAGPLR
jgi:hypothetical protein